MLLLLILMYPNLLAWVNLELLYHIYTSIKQYSETAVSVTKISRTLHLKQWFVKIAKEWSKERKN